MKLFNRFGLMSCLVAVVVAHLGLTVSDATAQVRGRGLAAVCPSSFNITTAPGRSYFIYKNSAPIRSGGVGTPLVGFRKQPTLIMNRGFSRGWTTIYDKNGNTIGRCPWASAHGHSGGRYRCTMETSSLRRSAVRSSRSAAIYFKLNASQCAYIPDAGRCYGSVKGLCNRLIS